MFRFTHLLGVAILTTLGCAQNDNAPTQAPADHPANPRAASAPPRATSATLTVTEPVEAAPPAMMDHQSHGSTTGHTDPSAHSPVVGGSEAKKPVPDASEDPHAGHAIPDASPQPGEASTGVDAIYVCPMHPEVTSPDANARCPQCGMKLKLQVPAEGK